MKQFLKNWNLRRLAYLIIGTVVVVTSIIDKNWLFAVLGLYFGIMGLLGLGCASGNCSIPANKNTNNSPSFNKDQP